jgi:hypothetical protein
MLSPEVLKTEYYSVFRKLNIPAYQFMTGQVVQCVCSQRSTPEPNCTKLYQLYQKSDYVFPEMKLRSLIPNSYIHACVSDLYILRIGLPILLQQNKQTDHGKI